jgi:hypothetical protein
VMDEVEEWQRGRKIGEAQARYEGMDKLREIMENLRPATNYLALGIFTEIRRYFALFRSEISLTAI